MSCSNHLGFLNYHSNFHLTDNTDITFICVSEHFLFAHFIELIIAPFEIGGNKIKEVDAVKYVGHVISNYLHDDKDTL